jgi:hypothetical protein
LSGKEEFRLIFSDLGRVSSAHHYNQRIERRMGDEKKIYALRRAGMTASTLGRGLVSVPAR